MRCWMAMPPPSAFTRSMLRSRDRFAVVEEPVEPVERNLAIDLLVHVQGTG